MGLTKNSMRKLELLTWQNREIAKKGYNVMVNRMTANNPVFETIQKLIDKKLMPDDQILINREFKKKKHNLSWNTKEKIFKISQNLKKQKFKIHRCKVCQLDIPGGQDIVLMHMRSHFKKDGDEEYETHPYYS